MIEWTGLALWKFEFLFPGSLTFTFQLNYLLLLAMTLEKSADQTDIQKNTCRWSPKLTQPGSGQSKVDTA